MPISHLARLLCAHHSARQKMSAGRVCFHLAALASLLAISDLYQAQAATTLSSGQVDAYELSVPAKSLVELPVQPRQFVRPRRNPLAGEPGQGHRGTWNRARENADSLIDQSKNTVGR